MEARALRIHEDDDVAVLLSPALAAGTTIRAGGITVTTTAAVMSGHKVALRSFAAGELVRKYGQPFGRTTAPIAPGEWVHTHNVATTLGANEEYVWEGEGDAFAAGASVPLDRVAASPRGGGLRSEAAISIEDLPGESSIEIAASQPGTPLVLLTPPSGVQTRSSGTLAPAAKAKTFHGYVRADGRVGVRNELWVLCTVGCINKAAEEAARRAHAKLARENGGPVDGVYAFTHPYGCAQMGGDLLATRSVIAALAAHPNCGGVLLMGLGCENNQLTDQVAELRCGDPARVRYFAAQETGDEVEEAVRHLEELAAICEGDQRVKVPASRLVLGMKCGGSDGFSGLTANPLVGVLSDRLADWGGTSILTEVPEMFGAERLLMSRATDEKTFYEVAGMINSFKDYFRRYDEPISENPAPGNKAGGITTLEEKSLGCIQKGGARAPVRHVLAYGAPLPADAAVGGGGLALAWGPGSDVVSCTTLAAAGAQLLLFTTGRGTPFGTCVPTLKLSTNSDLARRKPHWIDFDAGRLIEEGVSLETLADDLQTRVLAAASGEYLACNERNGYREIALFKDGVIN